MAEIIWTEPALSDLDAIADYIALDKPDAASTLVARIFHHVERLTDNPKLGSIPRELRPIKTYRQIVEPPCRIFYRVRNDQIFIVHVLRGERQLKRKNMTPR